MENSGRPADAVAEPDGHSGSAESDVSRDEPRGGDGKDKVDDPAVAATTYAANTAAAVATAGDAGPDIWRSAALWSGKPKFNSAAAIAAATIAAATTSAEDAGGAGQAGEAEVGVAAGAAGLEAIYGTSHPAAAADGKTEQRGSITLDDSPTKGKEP